MCRLSFDFLLYSIDLLVVMTDEMCKDEARHGKGFDGLLKRYFG